MVDGSLAALNRLLNLDIVSVNCCVSLTALASVAVLVSCSVNVVSSFKTLVRVIDLETLSKIV